RSSDLAEPPRTPDDGAERDEYGESHGQPGSLAAAFRGRREIGVVRALLVVGLLEALLRGGGGERRGLRGAGTTRRRGRLGDEKRRRLARRGRRGVAERCRGRFGGRRGRLRRGGLRRGWGLVSGRRHGRGRRLRLRLRSRRVVALGQLGGGGRVRGLPPGAVVGGDFARRSFVPGASVLAAVLAAVLGGGVVPRTGVRGGGLLTGAVTGGFGEDLVTSAGVLVPGDDTGRELGVETSQLFLP